MNFLNAFLEAVIVSVGFYITIYFFNNRAELGIECNGFFMKSRSVNIVAVINFFAAGYISYARLAAFYMPLHILTLILIYGMSVLAVTDRIKKLVPNKFLLALLLLWAGITGLAVIFDIEGGLELLGRGIGGAAAGGIIFLLCYLISGHQLGAGDVKLAFIMGLYMTGQRIMGGITYGVLLCCVYSVVQLLRKRLGMKDGVALVPFLYLGVLITLIII
ncbi:MAG: prepilin peptidase [Lachnospiraceae bacterium]|nr:prepilin peptidase [Lachnospiraceae bacterium]